MQEHAVLGAAAKPLPPNPLLRGQAPDAYVMHTLASVKVRAELTFDSLLPASCDHKDHSGVPRLLI